MLSRIREKYRENGVQGIVLALISRFPGVRAVCVYYVYRLPFDQLVRKQLSVGNLKIVLVKSDSMGDLIRVQDKPDIFAERFQMGHYGFVAYVNNDPVAYLWGQEGPVHVERRFGFEVPIKDNQVFYYDSYTIPEWRKSGVGRALIQESIDFFKNGLGKSELIAIIETGNLVSQKTYERMGFVREAMHIHLDIIGKKINKQLARMVTQ